MLRAQVFTAIRWTATARILSQIITWGITLVVIKLLTPADYGLLAMATIFLGLLFTIADVGLGPALVQRTELSERELRLAFGIILVFHLVLAAILGITAPLIARFFDESKLVPIIRVLSLQLVLGAFAIIPDSVLQRQFEFRKRSLLDLAATVTGSLITLTIALTGGGVWALVIGSMTTQAFKTIGINLLARCLMWPKFSFAGMGLLLTSGSQVTLGRIIWSIFIQTDAFIAGKWLGKEALGYYSVSMHLASLPTQRISALISQVAFPAFSRIQHDLSRVASHTLLGVRVLSFVVFPVLWGMSSVAPEIVKAILGRQWTEAIIPLQILALVMPLRTISIFLANPIAGLGRFDVGLANVVLASLVMVTAFVVGVQWGLLGLCFAWLIGTPVVFLANMQQNMRVLKVPLRSLLVSMARPTAAASMMYGIVEICRATVFTQVTDLTRLIILILVGAIAYGVLTLILNRQGLLEVLDLLKGITGHRSSESAPGNNFH